jgi:5-methylcytosine-specific restriction protein A
MVSSVDELWSDEELKDSVLAYKSMQSELRAGNRVVKSAVYKNLARKWGRSEKSYEMRMSNISAILDLHGRAWIKGLKPLSNVGTNVAIVIEKYLNEIDGATDLSNASFDIEVANKVKAKSIPKPVGNPTPVSKKSTVTLYERDRDVKAWLLKFSNGLCECCQNEAPFISDLGIPFLEVHHVIRLADGGADSINNAVAVCPNCHRALHHSKDKSELIESLYRKIDRLFKT